MREAVAFHRLDLSGLTLFTEIGTRGFVTTPFIAAMGDAKHVYAITRDSVYGTASSVASFADRFAKFCEMEGRVEVVTVKTPATLGRADIVTNLGFVRPIDAETVDMMKPGVVVAMMCEGWEFRDDDLDLDACARRGVAVVETNENYPGLTVFDFCGPLCVKLLLEAEIEVYKSQIVLVSSDKFGLIIEDCLRRNGAQVRRFARLSDPEVEGFLAAARRAGHRRLRKPRVLPRAEWTDDGGAAAGSCSGDRRDPVRRTCRCCRTSACEHLVPPACRSRGEQDVAHAGASWRQAGRRFALRWSQSGRDRVTPQTRRPR